MSSNFALEFAIKRVQVNQDCLKLNGTHQLLTYGDDVNILALAGHVARMGRIEVCTGCWWRSLWKRNHWEDQGLDGRIILRWIIRKLEGVVGTGWS
jgi:hypothetical protein